VNSSTANYTYFKNGSNPLNGQRLQSDGTKTYAYDNNGNITGDGTYTYTWDYENRLTGITGGGTTASYSYDYLGRRKSKTVNGVATTYLYAGPNLIREMGTTTADYVFGPGIDHAFKALTPDLPIVECRFEHDQKRKSTLVHSRLRAAKNLRKLTHIQLLARKQTQYAQPLRITQQPEEVRR